MAKRFPDLCYKAEIDFSHSILFHIPVGEIGDFLQRINAVLHFGKQQRKVVGHAGVDRQRNGGPVCRSLLRQPHTFRQEEFVAARLDQHRGQTGQVGVYGRKTGILAAQLSFVLRILDRNVQRRPFT